MLFFRIPKFHLILNYVLFQPFYPDFYDSIHHPTPYNPNPETVIKDDLPKVLVVAGSSTHHGGGPSHNAHDGPESSERHEHEIPATTRGASSSSSSASTAPAGFWKDVADDVGLPSSWKRGQLTEGQQAVLDSLLETTGRSSSKEKDHSRTLDKDEVKGVWVLVGLLAGSWVVGGIVNGSPKKVAEDSSH